MELQALLLVTNYCAGQTKDIDEPIFLEYNTEKIVPMYTNFCPNRTMGKCSNIGGKFWREGEGKKTKILFQIEYICVESVIQIEQWESVGKK